MDVEHVFKDKCEHNDNKITETFEIILSILQEGSDQQLIEQSLDYIQGLLDSVFIQSFDSNALSKLAKYYEVFKAIYTKMSPINQKQMADILSMLATARNDSRGEVLKYRLLGRPLSDKCGQDYLQRLMQDIISFLESNSINEELEELVNDVAEKSLESNYSIEAVDFLLEIGHIELLSSIMLKEKQRYKNDVVRVCEYLMDVESFDKNVNLRDIVVNLLIEFGESVRALLITLENNDFKNLKIIFEMCEDKGIKKQMCLILSRLSITAPELALEEEFEILVSNRGLSEHLIMLSSDYNLIEPQDPKIIYESSPSCSSDVFCNINDSSMDRLAMCTASALINCASLKDHYLENLLFTEGSFLPSLLGFLNLWNIDESETIFNLAKDDPGSILAHGTSLCGVQDENDIYKNVSFSRFESRSFDEQLCLLIGLGVRYAGTNRSDILNKLLPIVGSNSIPIISKGICSLSCGLIALSSNNSEVENNLMNALISLEKIITNIDQINASRFILLGLGLCFLGEQRDEDKIEDLLSNLTNHSLRKLAKVIFLSCSYAFSGDVLKIQKLLHWIAYGGVEDDKSVSKKKLRQSKDIKKKNENVSLSSEKDNLINLPNEKKNPYVASTLVNNNSETSTKISLVDNLKSLGDNSPKSKQSEDIITKIIKSEPKIHVIERKNMFNFPAKRKSREPPTVFAGSENPSPRRIISRKKSIPRSRSSTKQRITEMCSILEINRIMMEKKPILRRVDSSDKIIKRRKRSVELYRSKSAERPKRFSVGPSEDISSHSTVFTTKALLDALDQLSESLYPLIDSNKTNSKYPSQPAKQESCSNERTTNSTTDNTNKNTSNNIFKSKVTIHTSGITKASVSYKGIATFGLSLISMGEHVGSEMAIRFLLNIMHDGNLFTKRIVPLSIGLLLASNPRQDVIKLISQIDNLKTPSIGSSIMIALGIIGAGSTNKLIDDQLNRIKETFKTSHFRHLCIITQALVHLGKGILSLRINKGVISRISVGSLLIFTFACIDLKTTLLGKIPHILHYLTPAITPNILITLDEDTLETISVEAKIARTDKNGNIFDNRVICTPVIFDSDEHITIDDDKYIPLSPVHEGFVLMRKTK